MNIRQSCGLLCVLLSWFVCGAPVVAQEPDVFWDASDEENQHQIDHSAWQQVLDQHLIVQPQGVNRFDYQAAAKARTTLSGYLTHMQQLDPREYSKAEQKAYWINLYNALTVDLIVENYPVSSITKLGGLLSFGPWDLNVAEIAGQALSLNDIEHRILRALWDDHRIHFAVNCASMGCPNLAEQAYTRGNIEQLLEQGGRDFLNHPRGLMFDAQGRLHLSSIFDWYQDDFGDSQAQRLATLATYLSPPLAARLKAYSGRIHYDYNWDLNQP